MRQRAALLLNTHAARDNNLMTQISSSQRRVAWLLGAVSFFSFLYFYEGGGWNQNSRFDLLRAIVEQHTLQIDSYHENTQDKAHFRGHYYSDKAPGVVFLTVPFAVVARRMMRATGMNPQSARAELVLSYLVTAWGVALPTALAVVCLFFLAMRLGCDSTAAAFGCAVMGLATPIWAYASLFWAHALVGACLVFGLAAALKAGESTNWRSQLLWAVAVGLATGWATVTEYPAVPASALLGFFALWQNWPNGVSSRWRVAIGIGVGAGFCAIVLFSYLYAAFGSFRPSYSYYDPKSFAFMQQQGYMGLTYPHPDRLLKLMFGCARGLFFASPVMLAAPVGLWLLWKKQRSGAALVAASIAAYYFLFNASFYWWKAGLTFGPRYAGAAIPLLCLGVAASWQHASKMWRGVLLALAFVSVFVALMVVSTSSQLAMQDSCPVLHSSWPAFWSGQMSMNRESMLKVSEATGPAAAFNLGQLIGLQGLPSLIPLFGMWCIAAVIWRKIRGKS